MIHVWIGNARQFRRCETETREAHAQIRRAIDHRAALRKCVGCAGCGRTGVSDGHSDISASVRLSLRLARVTRARQENVKIISFVQRARFHDRRVCVFVIKTLLLIFYESSRRRGTGRDGAFAFAFATIRWMRRKPLQRESVGYRV